MLVDINTLTDSETGESFRTLNLKKSHKIPLKTMVEIDAEETDYHGLRLFVVLHTRDFDGTPLYSLSFDKNYHPKMFGKHFESVANFRVCGGWSDESLKII